MTIANLLAEIARRPRPTPAEFALSEYGVKLGETACPCGAVHEAERVGLDQKCHACGRPWDRLCRTCGKPAPPFNGPHGWSDAPGTCQACKLERRREERRALLLEVFPRMPDALDHARDYRELPHRKALDEALRAHANGPLLVYGGYGSGKTVACLRWAAQQFVCGRTVVWVPARRIVEWFKREMSDDESRDFRARLHSADVLVIDDWQAMAEGPGLPMDWTDNVQSRWSYLLQDLLDQASQRALVLITNRPPKDALGVLPGRIRSRFEGGPVVVCHSPDMRRSS